jgi:hypothetical protein
MMSGTILAIDLGKYKSVPCVYRTGTGPAFRTLVSTPEALVRLGQQHRPDVVVIEACLLAGWVHDLFAAVSNRGCPNEWAARRTGASGKAQREARGASRNPNSRVQPESVPRWPIEAKSIRAAEFAPSWSARGLIAAPWTPASHLLCSRGKTGRSRRIFSKKCC